MPIGSSSSITEHDRALFLFTDRMVERRRFVEYLHGEARDQVLCLHGDGGNGKSLLLKLLRTRYCRRLDLRDWEHVRQIQANDRFIAAYEEAADRAGRPVPCVYHDFGGPEGRGNPRTDWYALMSLRRELGSQGLKFPRFDLAVILYLRRAHELSAADIKSLFPDDEAGLVGTVVDTLVLDENKLPVADLALKIVKIFNKHFQEDLWLWWSQRGVDSTTVETLQRLDKHDLLVGLPGRFAKDLDQNAQQGLDKPTAAPRIVLLFDTHEAFWGTGRQNESTDSYFSRDEWLRRLLAPLYDPNHGVVVVVAGREPPRWPDAGETPIPAAYLDRQLIGHLDPDDARDYLARALVPAGREKDTPLLNAIVRAAEVLPDQIHPLHLGLLADTVLAAHERGKSIDPGDLDAAGPDDDVARKIVTRLLRYCNKETESAIKALAAARTFDRDVYLYVGDQLKFAATSAGFETLTSFSFVWRGSSTLSETYRVHETLRRLLAELDPDTSATAHAALEDYHRQKAIDEPTAIVDAIFHANRVDWKRSCDEWLNAMARVAINAQIAVGDALSVLPDELNMNSDLLLEGSIRFRAGAYMHTRANYDRAISELTAAAAAYETALVRAPLDITEHTNRGVVLAALGNLQSEVSRHGEARVSYATAVAEFDSVLALAPGNIDALMSKGTALYNVGTAGLMALESDGHTARDEAGNIFSAAVLACDASLRLAPDDVDTIRKKGDALQLLGLQQKESGEFSEATATLSAAVAVRAKLVELAPDDVANREEYASQLGALGKAQEDMLGFAAARESYAAAIDAYDAILAIAPAEPRVHYGRISVLLSLGEVQAHFGEYSEACTTYSEASVACDSILALRREDVDAYLCKARALKSLGTMNDRLIEHAKARANFAAASATYSRALEVAPDKLEARLGKADALRSEGKMRTRLGDQANALVSYGGALAEYEVALQLAPSFFLFSDKADTLESLGAIQARLGEHAEALANYEAAVKAYGAALAIFPEACSVRERKCRLLVLAGDLHVAKNQNAAAQACYLEVIANCDSDVVRDIGLDKYFTRAKAYSLRALAQVELALGSAPDIACAHLLAAQRVLESARVVFAEDSDLAAESTVVRQLIAKHCMS